MSNESLAEFALNNTKRLLLSDIASAAVGSMSDIEIERHAESFYEVFGAMHRPGLMMPVKSTKRQFVFAMVVNYLFAQDGLL